MKAVEACRYEEGGTVDAVSDSKWRFVIFESLKKCEIEAQENCQAKGLDCFLPVALHNTVVGPGNCHPGCQEYCCVEKWDFKWVEGGDACRGSAASEFDGRDNA